MKKIVIALATLTLGGCALTPAEIVEQGTRYEWDSSATPSAAAECVARNAENVSGQVAVRVRPAEAGSFEVIARAGEVGVLALVKSTRKGSGARMQTWIRPYTTNPAGLAEALAKGC